MRAVPPGDVAALAGAMTALLDDPEAATSMAARGREVAIARFGIESYVSALELRLSRLADGGVIAPGSRAYSARRKRKWGARVTATMRSRRVGSGPARSAMASGWQSSSP